MAGIFFAIVGASGVGKDSVLEAARPRLETTGSYHFPTRIITRPTDAGGEDHQSMSQIAFMQAVRDDRFSLWWKAHELHYALPETVFARLRENMHVVANISRKSVCEAAERFHRIQVIEITASPETIAKRLLARGRETADQIEARKTRNVRDEWSAGVPVTKISNDGILAEAVDHFTSAILSLSGESVRQVQTA